MSLTTMQTMRCPQLGRVQQRARLPSAIHAAVPRVQQPLRALTQPQLSRPGTAARSPMNISCRQRRSWGSSSRDDKPFRFKFNQVDISLAEDQMWRLLVPFAAVFGLAVLIGPIVVGITLSAVAVGAAFSAGALAFSTLLLPLMLLTGFGGLLSFGLMATLGAALVIPKMIFSIVSLGVVGGGLLLGWGGVNWLLSQQAVDRSSSSSAASGFSGRGFIDGEDDAAASPRSSRGGSSSRDDGPSDELRRMASELRDFDVKLAKQEEKRRLREWQREER